MNRALVLALGVLTTVCAASSAVAQGTKTPAKKDSIKALVQNPGSKVPAGTKAPASISAPAPKPGPAGSAKPDTKQATAPAGTKVDTKAGTKSALPIGTNTKATVGGAKAAPTVTPTAPAVEAKTPTIMREVFAYQQEGRRDPFATLLSSSDLRPTIADLRLTGILFDENGSNSIAVMRDIGTNALYRVTTGQTLGRMKVALIKRKIVIFSIESFGLNRQDSLVLGDTTKVRAK